MKIYDKQENEILDLTYIENDVWNSDYDLATYNLIQYMDTISLVKSDSGELLFLLRKTLNEYKIEYLEYGYKCELFI